MPITATAGGIEPLREVIRAIEVVAGEVEIEIIYEASFEFGRRRLRLRRRCGLGWSCEYGEHWLLLRTELMLLLEDQDATLHGRVSLAAGDKHHLGLAYVRGEPGVIPLLGAAADERLATTRRWWEAWSDGCVYQRPFRGAVQRSALALELMTYAFPAP